MLWRDLEAAAPEVAQPGRELLERTRVAMLATLRRDGSPRISPVEPYLSQGHLLFGSMSWSAKTRDLRRDLRCALHSAVSDADSGEGELKLYGRALQAEASIRGGCGQGWWAGRPAEAACVFSLDIDSAAFVGWDIEHGGMIVRRWSPELGYRQTRRHYP